MTGWAHTIATAQVVCYMYREFFKSVIVVRRAHIWLWHMHPSEKANVGYFSIPLLYSPETLQPLQVGEATMFKTLREIGTRSCGSVIEVEVAFRTHSRLGSFQKSRVAHFIDVGIGTQSSWMPVFWLKRHLLIHAVTEHYQKVQCGKQLLHVNSPKMV